MAIDTTRYKRRIDLFVCSNETEICYDITNSFVGYKQLQTYIHHPTIATIHFSGKYG